mmetsp:Transcript_49553/g.128565  ORF Transcript_49553/g.128565 Transcript_49553/m.128565 type:complete len:191 (+) Transcript_49553:92-664(+)
MLSPRAMLQEGEAVLAEQGKGEAVRPESDWPSSAPTRCPTSELVAFDDDQDADVHKGSWGATAHRSDEPAPLEKALMEAVRSVGQRPWRRSAMPAPREAPLRRLRSEAFWEQKAAAARRPECSPWELGVRQRRPCLGDESLAPTARRQWCQCARRRRKSARDVVRTRCAVPWVLLARRMKSMPPASRSEA